MKRMETIAVIGIGRLGLCLASQLEKAGHTVLGIDRQEAYIESIRNGRFRSPEPGVEAAIRSAANFSCTTDYLQLTDPAVRLIFIAVATPGAAGGGYDHSMVDAALQSLYSLPAVPGRRDIVIVCTTEPGYCDARAKTALEHGFHLSYKPEFIAQGSILHDLQYPAQCLIGEADEDAGELLTEVYSRMTLSRPEVCRMSRLNAEIAKLATNCFLTMKISFANAIGDLCLRSGADPEKVLNAVGSDRRIGRLFLRYGFGYGGPCFPRDNRTLRQFARQHCLQLHLSAAADEANQAHLDFQFEQYMAEYPVDQPIHFQTVTYKPGTVILEESQQLALAVRLAGAGRRVIIHERDEVLRQLKQEYGDLFEWEVLGGG